MDNNSYGSMIEPSNPYTNPYYVAPTEPNDNRKKWFVIGAIAIVVLMVGLLIALIFIKKSPNPDQGGMSEGNDQPRSDSEMEVMELVLDDKTIGQDLWGATETGATITLTKCQKLVSFGNQFVEVYGGNVVTNDVCLSGLLSVSTESKIDEDYPHNQLRIFHIQDSGRCLTYAFLDGFYSLRDFSIKSGECTGIIKNIEVAADE